MNTAKKIYESDADGIVRVEVPVNRPGQRVEVLVIWTDADEHWRDAVGLLKHDPIERGPQGEYEKRNTPI